MPALENPWDLEHMSLDAIKINRGAFNDTEIHASLPNLRAFEMFRCNTYLDEGAVIYTGMIELPDMSRCEKLEKISLILSAAIPAGAQIDDDPRFIDDEILQEIPFPRNLKTLRLHACIYLHRFYPRYPEVVYSRTMKNCDISFTYESCDMC